jgi:hypothetical protein
MRFKRVYQVVVVVVVVGFGRCRKSRKYDEVSPKIAAPNTFLKMQEAKHYRSRTLFCTLSETRRKREPFRLCLSVSLSVRSAPLPGMVLHRDPSKKHKTTCPQAASRHNRRWRWLITNNTADRRSHYYVLLTLLAIRREKKLALPWLNHPPQVVAVPFPCNES